jgi:hypothetical protein
MRVMPFLVTARDYGDYDTARREGKAVMEDARAADSFPEFGEAAPTGNGGVKPSCDKVPTQCFPCSRPAAQTNLTI